MCFTQNYKCQPHGGSRGKIRRLMKPIGVTVREPRMSNKFHENPSVNLRYFSLDQATVIEVEKETAAQQFVFYDIGTF